MNFFISDIHFSDDSTLKRDNRPFKTTAQFDKYIIKQINKSAKKGDTLYVVGDLIDCDGAGDDGFFRSLKYVKHIKADVIFITGNNEDRAIKYFFDNNFSKFRDYCIALGYKDVKKDDYVSFSGFDFYLTHKPIDYKKDYLNLFGHIHRGGGIYKRFGFNIGCDLNHFRPYSEQDILHLIGMKRKYWDDDKNIAIQ